MNPVLAAAKKVVAAASLFISVQFSLGCSEALEFEPPSDEIIEACNSKPDEQIKNLGGIKFSCETVEDSSYRYVLIPVSANYAANFGVSDIDGEFYKKIATPLASPVPSTEPALVVLIEGGSFQGHLNLMASTDPLMHGSSFFPNFSYAQMVPQLRPHVRTFLSNFVFAFLNRTLGGPPPPPPPASGPAPAAPAPPTKRYGHVYFVKGDVALKQIFLQTLRKATQNHPFVDLFIVSNGIPGKMLLDKNLVPSSLANLTGEELFQAVVGTPTGIQGSKVRAVFLTQSFVGKAPPDPAGGLGRSITCGLTKSFPAVKHYGNGNHNFYPLHRDFVAFETWYQTLNFQLAISEAEKSMDQNRTEIVTPAIQGMGCMNIFGYLRCTEQSQPFNKYPVTIAHYNSSRPKLPLPGACP